VNKSLLKSRDISMSLTLSTGLALALFFTWPIFASNTLTAEAPVVLPGPAGSFDFMDVDPARGRILAAHTGAKTLEVLDIKSATPEKAVLVGDAQGVAVDVAGGRYFIGNAKDESIIIIDAKTLSKVAEIKVDGPVDAMAFDSKNSLLYAAKDDGGYLWVIDPKALKISAKIALPGIPEVLVYDSKTNRIYLNIKDKNLVVRIDPNTAKVDASWPTAPAQSPHGLALDSERGRIFTAGKNGKIVSLSLSKGKFLSSADIPPGVDQVAFDPTTRSIYSACNGFVSVTEDSDNGLHELSRTPSKKGTHTLAVDPKTHQVWVSFFDSNRSYIQKFTRESLLK
jgi:DNA-binding beta-propeller fold protein YncE